LKGDEMDEFDKIFEFGRQLENAIESDEDCPHDGELINGWCPDCGERKDGH